MDEEVPEVALAAAPGSSLREARARPRRWRLAAAVVVTVVVVAVGAAAALTRPGDEPAAAESPLLEAPAAAPPVTAPLVTPVGLAPLPTPEPPPTEVYADVPVEALGSIAIPAIGLDHEFYSGVWLTVLDHGPGHWPGSARPGERGNTVFPGHRTTYTRPFHDLDLLEPGDEIVFRDAAGTHTYAVTETIVVEPTELWVLDQTEDPTVTLIACHPKGSARERIVVRGDLVASTPGDGAAAVGLRLADAVAALPL